MKTYKFTTFNGIGEEINSYTVSCYHIKGARDYAKKIIANSMENEVRNSRIKLS